jgi:hypothetical protein
MNSTPLLASLIAAPAEVMVEVVLIGNAAAAIQGAHRAMKAAYNTVRPHCVLGYRQPVPEARQPCAVATATPPQPHRAGLLEGENLT